MKRYAPKPRSTFEKGLFRHFEAFEEQERLKEAVKQRIEQRKKNQTLFNKKKGENE